jgi:hypothetical protein
VKKSFRAIYRQHNFNYGCRMKETVAAVTKKKTFFRLSLNFSIKKFSALLCKWKAIHHVRRVIFTLSGGTEWSFFVTMLRIWLHRVYELIAVGWYIWVFLKALGNQGNESTV